mgnify:CR=1 FL=1
MLPQTHEESTQFSRCDGFILINPYVKFQVKTEKPKREYLTSNELNEIRKKNIEIERLNTV